MRNINNKPGWLKKKKKISEIISKTFVNVSETISMDVNIRASCTKEILTAHRTPPKNSTQKWLTVLIHIVYEYLCLQLSKNT